MPAATKTVTPVAELLTERTAPELLFLESKLSALASYGITAKLLKEFLQVDVKLSPSTVWAHAMKIGQRSLLSGHGCCGLFSDCEGHQSDNAHECVLDQVEKLVDSGGYRAVVQNADTEDRQRKQ